MGPLGVGVKHGTPVLEDLIRHEQSGLLVCPSQGVIYGKAGTPVGAVCGDGYVRLGSRNGRGCLYAHRVIYEAVHGQIPQGLEIDHLNGDKADNRAVNLEAVTKSQNVRRAIALGLAPVGEKKSQAKLTDELVEQILATVGTVSAGQWAARLGVERSTIKCVRQGKTWRHAPCRGRSKPSHSPGHTRRRR